MSTTVSRRTGGEVLSRQIALRFSAINGGRAAERALRELAFDLLGPFDPSDMPAEDYAWLETAIDGAVRATGERAVEQLLAELGTRLEMASPAVAAGLERARNRHMVEVW